MAVLVINLPVIVTLVTSFKSPEGDRRQPGPLDRGADARQLREVLVPTERLNLVDYLCNSLARLADRQRPCAPARAAGGHAIARGNFGRQTLLPLVLNLRAVPLIIFAIPIYMGMSSGSACSTPGSASG